MIVNDNGEVPQKAHYVRDSMATQDVVENRNSRARDGRAIRRAGWESEGCWWTETGRWRYFWTPRRPAVNMYGVPWSYSSTTLPDRHRGHTLSPTHTVDPAARPGPPALPPADNSSLSSFSISWRHPVTEGRGSANHRQTELLRADPVQTLQRPFRNGNGEKVASKRTEYGRFRRNVSDYPTSLSIFPSNTAHVTSRQKSVANFLDAAVAGHFLFRLRGIFFFCVGL